ncbi:GNAT family N-acetyltransferase [Bacillus sp. FJAT-42376]|uniref:GNAT family N-acetyltransferase n=1 Tax=Bacillus sp. FJAT-42376 TaxID=2014076 RepID=UPI000F4D4644|nr:GNAT family N-acetyltransferase [Bacillus sp. FJAT-42376]AZB42783.1 GNAT family N-acetyltransferase [Bacillus sp. FJAT-42376]
MLISRNFKENDFSLLFEWVKQSPAWMEEETNPEGLREYMKKYEMYQGNWRVWEQSDKPAAYTYTADWAPSNEKPWLGTILVNPSIRRTGIGKKVIGLIRNEMKEKNHKVLFAGVPAGRLDWIHFLSASGFEQFKMEESMGKSYTILILPI